MVYLRSQQSSSASHIPPTARHFVQLRWGAVTLFWSPTLPLSIFPCSYQRSFPPVWRAYQAIAALVITIAIASALFCGIDDCWNLGCFNPFSIQKKIKTNKKRLSWMKDFLEQLFFFLILQKWWPSLKIYCILNYNPTTNVFSTSATSLELWYKPKMELVPKLEVQPNLPHRKVHPLYNSLLRLCKSLTTTFKSFLRKQGETMWHILNSLGPDEETFLRITRVDVLKVQYIGFLAYIRFKVDSVAPFV